MTPHMYVRNHMVVPALAWYLRIRMGCGTGKSPTSVPCCRNLRISLSSVRPLSMQIFSTWGTSTCSKRMMVCRGSLCFQLCTQSGVGAQSALLHGGSSGEDAYNNNNGMLIHLYMYKQWATRCNMAAVCCSIAFRPSCTA